ncbi:MAG: phosphoribosylformimino-5-aminoimidazole carboxamide ribotide isomerase [Spirochaetes bacterium]|nr:phosphoribosylformimino-5-aminoimidazole carboxamide ribotide isomerase [Spirochaetota bacterium]MBN2772425.1 phosphoribosylformimino-5-aminoimidazole carboxamide ribotide isomerase [Spirochaetota bacterium]
MRFRPCIDLHNGQVKQIVGSTLNREAKPVIENFVSSKDAAYYANMYKESNLTGGHIIKLGSGNDEAALLALKTYPGGMQLGGGVTAGNAAQYLDSGASHVIVTSYVFTDGRINWDNLNLLVKTVGKEKLVIDLSCRKKDNVYYVVTDKWQKFTSFTISEKNLDMLSDYCDEFLVHAADVEGKCSGIETELVTMLGKWANIPVTYAGGVSSLGDLEEVKEAGSDRIDITVGSALDIFGGKLSFSEVVRFCS